MKKYSKSEELNRNIQRNGLETWPDKEDKFYLQKKDNLRATTELMENGYDLIDSSEGVPPVKDYYFFKGILQGKKDIVKLQYGAFVDVMSEYIDELDQLGTKYYEHVKKLHDDFWKGIKESGDIVTPGDPALDDLDDTINEFQHNTKQALEDLMDKFDDKISAMIYDAR